MVNLYVFLWRKDTSIPEVAQRAMVGEKALPKKPGADAASVVAPPVIDEGAVESGDSLFVIFEREGIPSDEHGEILDSLKEHMDVSSIRVGQKYSLEWEEERLQKFRFETSVKTSVTVVRDVDGSFIGAKNLAQTNLKTVGVAGRIDSSLYLSIMEAGEGDALVSMLVDIFAYDIDFFNDQHKGDEFRLLVEKEYLDDEFIGYGRILAAEYKGKVGTFRVYSWKAPEDAHHAYYTESGESAEQTFLKTPLKFVRISSKFNRRRMHPILHRRRAHLGVDYAAPTGTPIRAASSGKIVTRGWCGGGGKCVKIQHPNGYMTVYFHMSRFQKGQAVGQRVSQKSVIGYVGSTGASTGPHLHFEVRKNGRAVDPLKLKMKRAFQVKKNDQPLFQGHVSELRKQLEAIKQKSVSAASNE